MALPAIIMLDTNIASHMIRREHRAAIMHHMQSIPLNRLCLSAITEAELRAGVARKPEAKRLARQVEAFLKNIETLPWDSDAADYYASMCAKLEKAGTPIGELDALIAAHALSMNALLVTSDKAFRHVKGLKTADWTKP